MGYKLHTLVLSAAALLAVTASTTRAQTGEPAHDAETAVNEGASMTQAGTDTETQSNPFFDPSPLDLNYPPFDRIDNSHYLPAFERGMEQQLEEIEAIVSNPARPDFDNTLLPLEQSGRILDRVSRIFYAMSSAHTNDRIKEIEAEIAPRLSAHNDAILLNSALFERISGIHERLDELKLDAESRYLVEETYKNFVRAGARLNEAGKQRLRDINAELARLQTAFSQNVLNEVNELAIVVDERALLAGLPEAEINAAADEAQERGQAGKFMVPLLNTTQQPVLSSLENRALRQRIYETSISRNSRGGQYDNRAVLSQTAQLRAEKAQLLGYDSHAEYILENQTAQTVEAVNQRLAELTPRAVANARREAEELQALIQEEGEDFELAAWDWPYYSEILRQRRYDFDESVLRPYFELDGVLHKGAFYAAAQLFGLHFEERPDLPVYQEDVQVFEVSEEDGSALGIFIFDPYARASKRGGAWMNSYVSQSRLLDTAPVVANHLNITEPAEGAPTLLTFDEVITLFHEFGHALHALFSKVTYPSFSGTSVPRDFVEFPSQVNEMWASWPEVFSNYARHYETGEPMPPELLERVMEAQKFNQGYATTEYLAASLIDQALHQLSPDQVPAAQVILDFEAEALAQAGADLPMVPPRYRLPYFSHIMGGYSAGYYSYIWSEVLDADTVTWFEENGGMLRANGQYFREALLSRGGSAEAMSLFREFRGREPDVMPLLERRGLNETAEEEEQPRPVD